ncbi:MAG: PKD domain-containing protein [Paludibacteraceae bacterium]|nr:PKD domain-containing protein [Paludibacteraceae bacterium]
MDRIFSKGTLLVLGIVAIIISLAVVLRDCTAETKIQASVSAKEIYLGEAIYYVDSTPGVKDVLWEFGNGDFSTNRRGSYVFDTPGDYQIRVKIDSSESLKFVVKVRAESPTKGKDPVRILAPSMAVKYEEVIFMGEGEADSWRWNFGDGGPDGSRERNPIVRFDSAGTYQVSLLAGAMRYPVYHTIRIVDDVVGRENDSITADEMIRKYLQRIIDREGKFNDNYHRIVDLLNGNSKLKVLIDNTNENDITSYCQGLYFMGKDEGIFIEKAIRDMEDNKIRRLLVEQKKSK